MCNIYFMKEYHIWWLKSQESTKLIEKIIHYALNLSIYIVNKKNDLMEP